MKVAVVSRSSSNGGAAIASRRLTEALRSQGIDATLLVIDGTAGPDTGFIVNARYPLLKPLTFMGDRLPVAANLVRSAFSRRRFSGALRNLWKIDTGEVGLPLYRHPVIKEADAVILNWVNQGMLSLDGIRKIYRQGKRVIWTMHDMWPLTGICHHAMDCRGFEGECSDCPLVKTNLAHKRWLAKQKLYDSCDITFVAVSNWLARQAGKSCLLKNKKIAVIPNPFSPLETAALRQTGIKKILFAAATLDNWIKGFDTFKEAVNILQENNIEIVLAGDLKNQDALKGFRHPIKWLGAVSGDENMARVYSECDVVVNCSLFENLPGTIIEGQAYGAIPVAFDRGGQRDIIDHLQTGFLVQWNDLPRLRAKAIAEGISWALAQPTTIQDFMRESVDSKFSYDSVASAYVSLLKC